MLDDILNRKRNAMVVFDYLCEKMNVLSRDYNAAKSENFEKYKGLKYAQEKMKGFSHIIGGRFNSIEDFAKTFSSLGTEDFSEYYKE